MKMDKTIRKWLHDHIAQVLCIITLAVLMAVGYGRNVLAQSTPAAAQSTSSNTEEELAAYKGINDYVVAELAKAQEEAEKKAAAEAKAAEEATEAASIEARKTAAVQVRNSADDKDNYSAPGSITDEEWDLLFGRMPAYTRRDSLPSMLPIRNHMSGFSRPVGLMLVSDYEWVEARFLGIANDDASDEVKEAAKKGEKMNPLDDEQMSEAFAELDEMVAIWEKKFEELTKEEQAVKVKWELCDFIMRSPIWAEQFLQFVERYDYFTANYGEEIKALREYFDNILEPRDDEGNPIPKEEAEGWDQVYEYASGHNGDKAYLRTTLEYRKTVTPLCQIILDAEYEGIVEDPLYRNWELDPETKYTNFLKTTPAKLTDRLKSAKLTWFAKDRKTANVSMGVNCTDVRIGEYKAVKTPKVVPGEPTYVPPKKTGGGGGTTTATLDKDPAEGSGPQGNAQDLAGDNKSGDSSGKLEEVDPETKHKDDDKEVVSQPVVTDPNGGNTQNGAPPSTGTITGGNTNSESIGTDQGTGETAKPSTENNSGKVSI